MGAKGTVHSDLMVSIAAFSSGAGIDDYKSELRAMSKESAARAKLERLPQ